MRVLPALVLISLFVGILVLPTITKVMALEEGIQEKAVEGVKKEMKEQLTPEEKKVIPQEEWDKLSEEEKKEKKAMGYHPPTPEQEQPATVK